MIFEYRYTAGGLAVTPLLILVAVPLLAGEPAAVQAGQEHPRVEITQSAGPPGGTVAVPIRLVDAERAKIGALKVTLRFSAASLTFMKVEVGGLGEAVGAEATAKSERDGPEIVLEITMATPETGAGREPLPVGPIAQMLFTVAKNLKPETAIRMRVAASGAGARDVSEPVAVAAKDAEIIVSNPTVISCFFYMH